MKISKLFLLYMFLFYSQICFSQNDSFSVMTWNIWHGGLHGDKSSDFEKDSVNTLNIKKVLEENKPDILFMQETYCCGMDMAKQAAYEYSNRASSNLSIHSKYPIIETIEIFKPFNSQTVIIDIEGQKVLCVNIWLHYLPDYLIEVKTKSVDSLIYREGATRLFEINSIIAEIDSLEKQYHLPVIIGGDFNSGSHYDWIESTKQWHYDKVIEWPVSKAMIEAKYSDSFREINPDPLKTFDGTWGYLNDGVISDRIDYIYYKSDAFNAVKSQIIMDDPVGGFFNSDHRAILTNFMWSID